VASPRPVGCLRTCRWSDGATEGPGRRGHPEIFRLDDMAQVGPGPGRATRHVAPGPDEYTFGSVSKMTFIAAGPAVARLSPGGLPG
jgi:hypothetical protein